MSDIDFNDNSFTLNIVKQDDFEKDTGVKISDLLKDKKPFTLENLGIVVNSENTIKTRSVDAVCLMTNTLTPVNTSNSFFNSIQEKEKKKKEKELEDLSKCDPDFPYIRGTLLTDAEKQLYHFMINNLCQRERLVIFPKVRLADIINVDTRITCDKTMLYKICYKHVDFLICEKDLLEPLCVIELDDYTHESNSAKNRDMFVMQALAACKIPVARIRCKIIAIERSDLRYAEELINKAIAPPCPMCGKHMIPKESRDGHRFYACEDFINCRYTIDIDKRGEELP